jgi:carnitine 3-dehydrogenase
MPSSISKIAVIGTGVIGIGWIIRFLSHNKEIWCFDPDPSQKKNLLNELRRIEKNLKNIYKITKFPLHKLHFTNSIKEAVLEVDLIQENVPENEKFKKKIIKEVSKWSKPNAIIASSSSGILPSRIQTSCNKPQRFLIAHPFNPVYLLPLVELVKGKKTSSICVNKSKFFYQSIGMKPLVLKKEVEGYLSDRLQEAIWRESLHIINDGLATTEELDRAIVDGPGLRWALMGTFLTFHLAGGKHGLRHMLEQFGPALQLPWTKLKAPKLTKKLSDKIIKGTKIQSRGKSIDKLKNLRDNFLVDLLILKNKYKLR